MEFIHLFGTLDSILSLCFFVKVFRSYISKPGHSQHCLAPIEVDVDVDWQYK